MHCPHILNIGKIYSSYCELMVYYSPSDDFALQYMKSLLPENYKK